MTQSRTTISPNDRLGFALFISIAIHALIIFGVGFSFSHPGKPATSLDVTLVMAKSEKAPLKPDYLAQFNQVGSGTEKTKQKLSTTDTQKFASNKAAPEYSLPQQSSIEEENRQTTIITTAKKTNQQAIKKLTASQTKKQIAPNDRTILQRSLDIASLTANLDYYDQQLSNGPRIRRLTSASTLSSSDAYYLDAWRRKVEMVGNLNYPEEARRNKLYGSLRLLVVILPDGRIESVSLLESSGNKVLDDAAMRIVRLAAPYAPFTPEMKKNIDRLEIIRTWQFIKNDSLISG
jgi:protein TonB